MSDIGDKAQAIDELLRDAALTHRRDTSRVPRKGIGKCLNCGDPVHDERRWCCAACRDDWEAAKL